MTIKNKSKDEVITFIPMQIYKKSQLGLNNGLLLLHAVHCVYMLNRIYVHF